MWSAMIFNDKNWTLCFIILSFCTIVVPFSARKIAVYLTYFHRTSTKSVLKFRVLLITESSLLRKGSFPIIGQHFYHFFSLKSYFHMKLIIRLYSVTLFFFFLYEFFALFLHSSFCIYSAPFSTILYIFKLFLTCKEVIKHNNNSRIFLFYRYKFYVT